LQIRDTESNLLSVELHIWTGKNAVQRNAVASYNCVFVRVGVFVCVRVCLCACVSRDTSWRIRQRHPEDARGPEHRIRGGKCQHKCDTRRNRCAHLLMPHIQMSQVTRMNESRHIYGCVVSLWCPMQRVRPTAAWKTYEPIMSHITWSMSHKNHMYKWVIHTYEYKISHTQMGHVTGTNESHRT